MESYYHRTCSILLLELFYISQTQVQDYPVSKHKGVNQTGLLHDPISTEGPAPTWRIPSLGGDKPCGEGP